MLIAVELQSCSSLKFKGGEYDGLIRFWYTEHFLFYLKRPSLCIEAELHCHTCTSADIFCSGFYCLLRLLNCRLKALHVRRIFHVALNFFPPRVCVFWGFCRMFFTAFAKGNSFFSPLLRPNFHRAEIVDLSWRSFALLSPLRHTFDIPEICCAEVHCHLAVFRWGGLGNMIRR